ncbi:hypothetical protein [Parvibium lacunae]|uniref:TM2 domain-containing protein n=1 Tax=Parvibium lacunae TaxID=1888893 RepID=A0A368L5P4_9BURK|nr:hypothetical protein [Parvibium lacunae]RCS58460.1 hypothetical protein DU000_06515 [Parvibium lacunae]
MAIILPNKTYAAWLAMITGSFGLHRFYLGLPYGWLYPFPLLVSFPFLLGNSAWLTHPALLAPACVVLLCQLETLRIALTPDEKWVARFLPHERSANSPTPTMRTGWGAIWAAIIALMLGAGLLMALLAIHIQRWVMGTVN